MPKTGAHLKIENFGSHVMGVTLEGNRARPECDEFRVSFPGGDVSVTRCSDGSYWIHARCDHREHGSFDPSSDKHARMTGARLDAIGRGPVALPVDGDTYHLAVKVERVQR